MKPARRPAALLLALALAACGKSTPPPTIETTTFAASLGVDLAKSTKLPSGVYIRDVAAGPGGLAVQTHEVLSVNYTGWLADGTQFDRNDSAYGFLFGLGEGTGPVKGWDSGVAGMSVGETRQLIIPFDQAYGENAIVGGYDVVIPAEAILVYQITVESIQTLESVPYDSSLNVDLSKSTRVTSTAAATSGVSMYYRDTVAGTGAPVVAGHPITVNYTLWLYDGAQVESTTTNNIAKPVQLTLASGSLIEGWVLGLAGMNVGGTRQLLIPPALAYGPSGSATGSIGPYTILVFSVSVVSSP